MAAIEPIDLWFDELKPDYQELAQVEPDFLEMLAISSSTIKNSANNIDGFSVLDRDLAEIKAEYEQQEPVAAAKTAPDVPEASASSTPAVKAAENNLHPGILDQYLAQIKADYEQRERTVAAAKLEPDDRALSVFSSPTIQASKNLNVGVVDSDLAQIKSEYGERDIATQVVKQEPQQAVQIAPQKLQVMTRREKVRQAQVWLKKLDKNSDERFWFDRFALKYDCRVEAAIDYLAAVKEI
ncbi:MAG: hypothetical protein MUE44_09620 [Oscillatoriaceae cyanobacterium Prado104]|jgi:hypothetical protein|nr:hypothetical protein [Oscillatoriaceae cyanobacterium Prado104]